MNVDAFISPKHQLSTARRNSMQQNNTIPALLVTIEQTQTSDDSTFVVSTFELIETTEDEHVAVSVFGEINREVRVHA